MARSILAAGCLAAMLLPGTALAQKAASSNAQKQPYCWGFDFAPDHSGQVKLTETGGRTQADLFFLYRADPAGSRFPIAGDPVVAIYQNKDSEAITPSIGIWYRFTLDTAGQPDSDILPVELSVTGGDFVDDPGDLSGYTLRIEYGAGQKLTFPVSQALSSGMNDLVGNMASVAAPPQEVYADVGQAELNRLVAALDGSPRTIVIARGGTDIAVMPIANRPVAGERDRMFGWIRAALPLLRKGQCPAS